jgi:hypothetical protein
VEECEGKADILKVLDLKSTNIKFVHYFSLESLPDKTKGQKEKKRNRTTQEVIS